jgi:hypothetical protein
MLNQGSLPEQQTSRWGRSRGSARTQPQSRSAAGTRDVWSGFARWSRFVWRSGPNQTRHACRALSLSLVLSPLGTVPAAAGRYVIDQGEELEVCRASYPLEDGTFLVIDRK